MLYHMYDLWQMALAPARLGAEATKTALTNPLSPLSYIPLHGQLPRVQNYRKNNT